MYFLGIKVAQSKEGLLIAKEIALDILDILEEIGMTKYQPTHSDIHPNKN